MRKLIVFNHVSLDGYFTDAQGDMSFARNDHPDAEWDAFVASNASGGGLILFGRITYELMASFWPTPFAAETMPLVAERMNNLPKVVFSRTLDEASWNNTRLVKRDLIGEIRRMKNEPGEDMVIFKKAVSLRNWPKRACRQIPDRWISLSAKAEQCSTAFKRSCL
jgi:dihydrofolate reductase